MVFEFIMYRGQRAKERYVLHCAREIANREDPYVVASTSY